MLEIVDPMVQWVLVSLDIEHIVSESLALDTDLEDWESVGVEMHPSGVLREYVEVSSTPESVLLTPVSDGVSLVELEVVVESLEVKVDLGSVAVLRVDGEVGGEDASPLGAGDVMVQKVDVVAQGGEVWFVVSEGLDVALEFSERFVVSVIKWGGIEVDDSCDSGVVVAGGGECEFSSESVSSEGSGGDLVFPHESDDVIGHFFHIEAVGSIRGTKVSGVEKPDISLVENLIFWICEEINPT